MATNIYEVIWLRKFYYDKTSKTVFYNKVR
jgi:hypothetical protein